MKLVVAAIFLAAAFLAGGIESVHAQRCTGRNCPPTTRPTPTRPTPPTTRPTPPTTRPTPTRPTPPTTRPTPTRPTPPTTRPTPTRPTPPTTRPTPTRPTPPTTRPTPPRPTRPVVTRPTTRPPTQYRRPRPVVTRREQLRDIHRNYHRVYSFRPYYADPYRPYVYYHHNPYYGSINHSIRFYNPYDYYRNVPYRFVYWDAWVRWGVSYNDGFFYMDNYPYFVYNGYRHRYSPLDTCDYELVDGYNNSAVATFHGRTCRQGYDMCADQRDEMNYRQYDQRYFCSERLDNSRSYNWDYNNDFYSDLDYYDGYDDSYYY